MALVDLLTSARDHFRANVAIVNSIFANDPIHLQSALQPTRSAFNAAIASGFAADFQPIIASGESVADRLMRLAAAHSKQKQVINSVFTDQVDRDAAGQNSLASLEEAFKKVFS